MDWKRVINELRWSEKMFCRRGDALSGSSPPTDMTAGRVVKAIADALEAGLQEDEGE